MEGTGHSEDCLLVGTLFPLVRKKKLKSVVIVAPCCEYTFKSIELSILSSYKVYESYSNKVIKNKLSRGFVFFVSVIYL